MVAPRTDSRGSSPRQARRKAATRNRIVDAAEELFAVDADSVTVGQIADAADVSVATVYQHFGGRDDVHLAVLERAVAAAQRHLLAAYRSDGPPMDRLIGTATAYLRFHLQEPRLFRMINMRQAGLNVGAPESPVATMLADQVEELTDQLAGVIADGIADGSIRQVDPQATARYLWGSMNGVFGLAVRPDRLRLNTAELLTTVVQGTVILVEGLAGPSIRDADGHLDPAILHTARARLNDLLDTVTATATADHTPIR